MRAGSGACSALTEHAFDGLASSPSEAPAYAGSSGGCVILATEDVQRGVRLAADDPAVVARWHVEEVACLHHDLPSVVHLHRCPAAEHEPDMLDLARGCADGGPDMLRPAPTRLVGGAPDRRRSDAVELEPPLLERARLGGLVEVHAIEVHDSSLRIVGRRTA